MPKAELPADEPLRLETLRDCNVLDTPPEADFDDLTQLAVELSGCPISLVSLVDSDRQWFKSSVGVNVCQTSRDVAFCAHAILRDEPLVINDASQDPLTLDNALVSGPPNIRFYAGFPLRVSNGQPLGTLCVIDSKPRELSEEVMRRLNMLARQAASQLELRRLMQATSIACRKAEHANKMKSDFIANVSHEIRTPLTAIIGYSDVLMESSSEVRQQRFYTEAVSGIRRNGDHLLGLVNDILDLAKIEAGKLDIDSRPVSPKNLLDDVITMLRSQASAKDLTIEREIGDQIPNAIVSDPIRLKQIVTNLLGNAIKFTERGFVRASLAYNQDADEIVFAIQDTGIGLSASQIASIEKFEAFHQADSSISRRYGGSGLGLRISKMLINLLGGKLNVTSEIGKGSLFSISLPVIRSRLNGVKLDTTKPNQSTVVISGLDDAKNSSLPLAGCNILVAEDGIDNQRILKHFLGKAGADLVVVNNGLEAVNTVSGLDGRQPFDVVLMDLEMPVMDGMTALRRIKDLYPNIPVVALTAHATEEVRSQCYEIGFERYLTKPFERNRLIAVCQELAVDRIVCVEN